MIMSDFLTTSDLFIYFFVYAALGRPVAPLLLSPLPDDLRDRLLPVSA